MKVRENQGFLVRTKDWGCFQTCPVIGSQEAHFLGSSVCATLYCKNLCCVCVLLGGTGDSQRDSRESFAIDTPIFIARQADSHESSDSREFARFARITPLRRPQSCFCKGDRVNTFSSATDPPLFLGVDTCRDPGEGQF